MKVSTKGRYAIRLMLDLAMHDNGGYIPIREISQRQNISDKYLEQIISILSRAGFVTSVRGAGGGYRLTHPLKSYTIGMILRVTEGSLAPVPCLESNVNTCERSTSCAALYVWEKLYDAINDVLDSITLEDLVDREKSLQGDYMI
ncbi:MAG: RrF2 family transcriptional regulator [Oscillospiraceae bacterium]